MDNPEDTMTSWDKKLPVWSKYVEEYNTANPNRKIDEFIVLLGYSGGKVVFKMIQSAKKNPATKEVATALQEKLIRKWLNEKVFPIQIFEIVETGKLEDVLTSPYLPVWTRYLEEYNALSYVRNMDEVDVLLRYYKKGAVFRMLEEAKKDERTKNMAKKWEEQLVRKVLEKEGKIS
ncbi:hypothetical protein DD238_006717 [Peronospora effusa]|uniref:RxLR effector protein n=1 Tax=Peronospora effusa TaxID=542832 RepID=A0A3M6V9D2_9STRA|nr:hypothetical protein DD238_006717 [Peronospora effusa]RQM17328.1 hypothetical protein DD237_001118 [Peronospora effusa]